MNLFLLLPLLLSGFLLTGVASGEPNTAEPSAQESSRIIAPVRRWLGYLPFVADTRTENDASHNDNQNITVTVADPFLDIHSGPGRGYPIIDIVEHDQSVEIEARRNDWFRIARDGKPLGWAPRYQLEQTLALGGQPIYIESPDYQDFATRQWEAGLFAGEFGDVQLMSGYAAYAMTENLALEVSVSQALGDNSNSKLLDINIKHSLFPQWRYEPFLTLGIGKINSEPDTTLVQSEDSTDTSLNAGGGLQIYISRRFMFRWEYKRYTVLLRKNHNEDINQWKAGFSLFL